MDQVRAGVASIDDAGFADFVEPHWAVMVALARRLCAPSDVEDVVQDALVAAWRLRDRYDSDRGSPRVWLLTLTADHARRAGRRRRARSGTFLPYVDSETHDVAPDVDLARAVARLADRQRVAVTLFYYLQLPISEIAAVMGCSQGTVKSTLSDARKRLRQLLGKEF